MDTNFKTKVDMTWSSCPPQKKISVEIYKINPNIDQISVTSNWSELPLLRMRSLGLEPPPPPRMCIAKHLGNKETRGFAAAITVLWFCLWPSFRRSTSSRCNTTVFQSLYWLKERVLLCTIICLFSWLGNSSLLQLRLRWKYYMIRYALRVCWLKFIQFFVFPLYLFIYTVK